MGYNNVFEWLKFHSHTELDGPGQEKLREALKLYATISMVLKRGTAYIVSGDKGKGKTEALLSFTDLVTKIPYTRVYTNIVFYPDEFEYCEKPPLPDNVVNIESLFDCLVDICETLEDFYKSSNDEEKRIMGQNKLPPRFPRFIMLIDEAEGFLTKFQSIQDETYQFSEFFLPLLRKFALCLVLIYHEENASIKALREGGKMLAGIIRKKSLKEIEIDISGMDRPIQLRNMTTTKMRYDSWTLADADLWGNGLAIMGLRNALKGVGRFDIPSVALKYLRSLEGAIEKEDPYLTKDIADIAAWVYMLKLTWNGEKPPGLRKIADAFTARGYPVNYSTVNRRYIALARKTSQKDVRLDINSISKALEKAGVKMTADELLSYVERLENGEDEPEEG